MYAKMISTYTEMKTVTNQEAGLAPQPANAVSIVVTFNVNVPVAHQTFFTTAAAVWMTRIPSYKAGVTGPATITISASEPAIDGALHDMLDAQSPLLARAFRSSGPV